MQFLHDYFVMLYHLSSKFNNQIMRTIPILISVFFYTVTASAQSNLNLGLDIGMTRSNILVNHSMGSRENIPARNYGVSVNYSFYRQISIQSGLYFSEKGAVESINYESNSPSVKQTSIHYSSEYLTMPILIRYSTKGQVRFFANTGMYLGYLLNYEMSQFTINEPAGPIEDLKEETNSIDAGLTLGIGIQIILPIIERLSLSLELRENLGLIPLESNRYSGNVKSYNNSIGLQFCLACKI